MGYKVVWAEPALAQLKDIVDHLAVVSPMAVERVGASILKRVEALSKIPFGGAVYRSDSRGHVREVPAANYRIFYRVDEELCVVRVVAIWHGARGEPVWPLAE